MRRRIRILLSMICLCYAFFTYLQPIESAYAQTMPPKSAEGLPLPAMISPSQSVEAAQARQPTEQTVARDWWWLVFQDQQFGNGELYRARPDGRELKRLTFHVANDTQPTLNPAVKQIAFVSTRDGNAEIYTMNLDGGDLLRLTTHPMTDTLPAWSPDSAHVVFTAWRDGNAEIYRMTASGGNQQRLTGDPAADLFPSWSPNGQQIAWVRRSGTDHRLWVMNADGSNQRALTGPLSFLQHVVWSPDGSRLALDYDADNDGFNELAVINTDGSNLQMVLDSSPPFPANPRELWLGGWTPDGAGLTYSYQDYMWNTDNFPKPPTLVFVRAGIEGYQLADKTGILFFWFVRNNSPLLFFPSVRSEDLLAPQSQVVALPAYSRRGSLFIQWSAQDRGPAGLAFYDIQVRPNNNPNWQDWKIHTEDTSGSDINFGMPGTTIRTLAFRSRATDRAENTEAWPTSAQGDTTTTIFNAIVAGTLTDGRGIPRAQVEVTVSPLALELGQTDLAGNYLLRLPDTGEYQINQTPFIAMGDQWHPFYLKPTSNLIENGDLESSGALQGWTTAGAVSPTLTQAPVQNGQQAVQLGATCPGLCLTAEQSEILPQQSDQRKLVVDTQNQVHLVWRQFNTSGAPQGFTYRRRNTDGTWLAPETVVNQFVATEEMAVAADGTVYVVWQSSFSPDASIVISKRGVQGGWSAPMVITAGTRPRVIVDQGGQIHLLYQRCPPDSCMTQRLYYRSSATGDTWSPELTITDAVGETYLLAERSAHQVYLIWTTPAGDSRVPIDVYGAIVSGGQLQGTKTRLQSENFIDSGQLLPGSDGTLHLLLRTGSGLFHRQLAVDGSWSLPVQIIQDRGIAAIDAGDILHVFTPSAINDGKGIYRWKAPGRPWSAPQGVSTSLVSITGFAAGGPNRIHFLDTTGRYAATALSTQAGESTLQQTVAIPVAMHKPTLSFMMAIQGNAEKGSRFALQVEDAISTTEVLSATQSRPWQLQWVDMSRWQGQTITLTFMLQQAQDAQPLRVYLDDVALGAWQTPVPQVITPSQVEVGLSTTIVITGENFIATPTVRVGDVQITDVQWVDEQTIQATLPATLPPGLYQLAVINPGNGSTLKANALLVGRQLFLPLIVK